jgi:hypothetical protein
MTEPRENRVPIMMSDDELKAVDDWRFANRAATRSAAIRHLVALGLAHASESPLYTIWLDSIRENTVDLMWQSVALTPAPEAVEGEDR